MKFGRLSISAVKVRVPCSSRFVTSCPLYESIKQETDVDRMWLMSEGVSRVTTAPSAAVKPVHSPDMTSYLQERGFDVTVPSSLRTFSSLLTFPLTMAYLLKTMVISGKDDVETSTKKNNKISVLVVGARSEATLPIMWWRELLMAFGSSSGSSCSSPVDVEVGFLGPDLMVGRQKGPAASYYPAPQKTHWAYDSDTDTSMSDSSSSSSSSSSSTASVTTTVQNSLLLGNVWDGKSNLHDHPNHAALLADTDVVFLFNPGFGSPPLRSAWRPSIELLLRSRVPVVASAHSHRDLCRDIHTLHEIAASMTNSKLLSSSSLSSSSSSSSPCAGNASFLLPPHRNPFASSKRFFDAKEEEGAQVVTTNEFVYVFKGLS